MKTLTPNVDSTELETATKLQLVFWYCQIRSGRWPKSFPYAQPADWDRMDEVERASLPAVIELNKITTSRVASKDLCLVYNILGFGGSDMSADEVQCYWENGGWQDWGTRMAC